MLSFYDSALVEEIPTKIIRPARLQLRSNISEIEELASSIRQHGLLQPLLVRQGNGDDRRNFEIVAGNRRFFACKSLKMLKIPCIVRTLNDKEAFELALTENIQRETLNPLEEAEAFRKYILEKGWGGAKELAKKLGRSESFVSQRISLLKLPPEVCDMISASEICATSARAISREKSAENMIALARLAKKERSSSREIQRLISKSEDVETQPSWDVTVRSGDKDSKLLKKSVLILRVALTRLDSLIERADNATTTKEHLFLQRNSLHQMIDASLRLSLKRKTIDKSTVF